ncbi:hypothetical protein PHYSODRAFT_328830 [Phytophthora sojae]|uniref:Uncharacterized protein n=1 Tax=Phytophthora sojae (strain P6497) TaxID=1094619 RepID=G4Z384_PHYSP|nr:hypothetical protein PHYSODRAFT_328830 [Phytophthora sojae]EGZ20753.1 hypothetical protein PHYSODRAFT_328830 [Phytophthora sojae]|eukprot:XP_009523470.1 hypothetical protein PHYSODRAFT_328830 [Phytophthora sojae]
MNYYMYRRIWQEGGNAMGRKVFWPKPVAWVSFLNESSGQISVSTVFVLRRRGEMDLEEMQDEELSVAEMQEMMAAITGTSRYTAQRENHPRPIREVSAAASAGDLAKLKGLVDGGPRLDKEEDLRESARAGHLEVVRYLMG